MPTASNVLCGCGRFMRCLKNSITVEELTTDGEPYKLWDADLFECVECDNRVITGFGREPLAEAWHPRYQELRERYSERYNDMWPIYQGRCLPLKGSI